MSDKARSYRNTAIIGVSSVVNILLSVVRNKIFSIYLNPSGIGQFGLLSDFINSVFAIGSLGVSNSGVQAVSKASTENGSAVRKVYNSLILWFTSLSFLLVLAIILFAGLISKSLAGDDSYVIYLRIACFAVLFRFRSSIQSILITGMKRVGLLAKGNILQGVITTLLGIALVMGLKNKAVPFLVLSIALGGWLITYVQSRKVLKDIPGHKALLAVKEMKPILILGISSLWASILENVVNLVNKSWINHFFGKEYLGYYQVAVGFTASYIGFITASIIMDYYPRLTSTVVEGSEAVNKYVNQQIGISIVLIMPIMFVMLTFSKLFLAILFSAKFLAANSLIGYTVAATFIQVVAWPIAFVFLAHGSTKTYILTESVGNGTMLILCFIAVRSGNFPMLGLAYALHYVVYLAFITYIFITRFQGEISRENIQLFLANTLVITAIIVAKTYLNDQVTYMVGSGLIALYFYRSRKEYLFMFNTLFRKK